jgi:hypothetical protein
MFICAFHFGESQRLAPKGCEAKAEHHRSPSGDDWGSRQRKREWTRTLDIPRCR